MGCLFGVIVVIAALNGHWWCAFGFAILTWAVTPPEQRKVEIKFRDRK